MAAIRLPSIATSGSSWLGRHLLRALVQRRIDRRADPNRCDKPHQVVCRRLDAEP
jgi:hypothetical protein